jgi:hypothetical protein
LVWGKVLEPLNVIWIGEIFSGILSYHLLNNWSAILYLLVTLQDGAIRLVGQN